MSWLPLTAGAEANAITIPLLGATNTNPGDSGTDYGVQYPNPVDPDAPQELSWIASTYGGAFAHLFVVGVFRVTVTATYTNSSTAARLGISIAGGDPYGPDAAGVELDVTAAPTEVTFSYDVTTVPRDTGWSNGGFEWLGGYYLAFINSYVGEPGTLDVTAIAVTVERLSQTWLPIGPTLSPDDIEWQYEALSVGSRSIDGITYDSAEDIWRVDFSKTADGVATSLQWVAGGDTIGTAFHESLTAVTGTPLLYTSAAVPPTEVVIGRYDGPGAAGGITDEQRASWSARPWLPLGSSGFFFIAVQGIDAPGFTYPESVVADWTAVPHADDVTLMRWWYAEVVDGSDVAIIPPAALTPLEDYTGGAGAGFTPGGFLDESAVGRTWVALLEVTTPAGVVVYRSTEVTLA